MSYKKLKGTLSVSVVSPFVFLRCNKFRMLGYDEKHSK